MPQTLTEAQAKSGLIVITGQQNAAYLSTARMVPYVELYRQRTSLIETPAERLQKVADVATEPHR